MNMMSQFEYMNVQEELSKIDDDEEQNKYIKMFSNFTALKKGGIKN